MSAAMPDQLTHIPPVPDRSRSGVAVLDRWYCDGNNPKNGLRCGQVLMEYRLTAGSTLRIKCHKCGTWHTLRAENPNH